MLPRSLFLLILPPLVYSGLVNKTIDDESGDEVTGAIPVYGGDDGAFHWTACSASDCTKASGHGGYLVDPSKVNGGTWHDGIAKQGGNIKTISLSFTGVAFYVYYVLVVNGGDMTEVSVSIDGITVGDTFTFNSTVPGRNPDDPAVSFLYNQAVFQVQGLSNTKHQVVISSPIPQGTPVLGNIALFDYAVYTQQTADPVPPPPSPSPPPSQQSSSSQVPPPSSVGTSSSVLQSSSPIKSATTITDAKGSTLVIQSTSGDSNPAGSQPTFGGDSSQGSNTNGTTSGAVVSSHSSNTGPIVGGIIGGFFLIGIVVCILFWMKRRNQRKATDAAIISDPFAPGMTSAATPSAPTTIQRAAAPVSESFWNSSSTGERNRETDPFIQPFGPVVSSASSLPYSGTPPGAQASRMNQTSWNSRNGIDPFVPPSASLSQSSGDSQARSPVPLTKLEREDLRLREQIRQQNTQTIHSITSSQDTNQNSMNPPASTNSTSASESVGLRNEVAQLRAEVERLRSRDQGGNQTGHDAPPAYYTK